MTVTLRHSARDDRVHSGPGSRRANVFGDGAPGGRVGMSHVLCRHKEFSFLVSAASVRAVVGGQEVHWSWPTEFGETSRAEYGGRTFPVREAPRSAAGHVGEPPGVALIVESSHQTSVVAADRVTAVRGDDILRTWRANDRLGGLAPEWVAIHELDSVSEAGQDGGLRGASSSTLVPELRTTLDVSTPPRSVPSSTGADATTLATSRASVATPRESAAGLLVWPSAAPWIWVGAATPFVLEVLNDPMIVPISQIANGVSGLLPWRGVLLPVVDLEVVFAEIAETRATNAEAPKSRQIAAVVETEVSAKWLAVSMHSAPRRLLEPVGYEPESTRFSRSAHLLWGSFRRDREWLMLPAWERLFAKLLLDAAANDHMSNEHLSNDHATNEPSNNRSTP